MEKEDMEWDWKVPPMKRPRARATEDSDSEKHPKLKQTDTTLSIPFPDTENPDYDSVSEILTLLDPSFFGYPYPPIPFPNITPLKLAGFKFKGVMNTNKYVPEVEEEEEEEEDAPPPTPSYVKLPADNSLLQKLLLAQPSSLSHHHSHSDLTLIKSAVAYLVFQHTLPDTNENLWNIIRADGFDLFIRVIIAASSLVYKLYSKDYLYLIASEGTGSEQIETLWKDIQWMHQDQRLPFSKVCKEVVRLMAENNDKYSSISEAQVDFMTNYFRRLFCDDVKRPANLDPYSYTYPIQASNPFADKDKDEVMLQITSVVSCMEYPPEKEDDDDHTSWLVRLSRGEVEVNDLVVKAMVFVKSPNLDYNKTLHIRNMLRRIIHRAKDRMKFNPMDVQQPLFALHQFASLPPVISEIVQVAELRRMDLGNCFIGRSHLIWAFYELGYGLHAKVRDQIEVHADEDHPPYHIYLAAFNVTRLLGESTTQLDHFIFVVIHSKNIGYDGEKIVNFVKTFKDLQERHEFIEGAPSPRQ